MIPDRGKESFKICICFINLVYEHPGLQYDQENHTWQGVIVTVVKMLQNYSHYNTWYRYKNYTDKNIDEESV